MARTAGIKTRPDGSAFYQVIVEDFDLMALHL